MSSDLLILLKCEHYYSAMAASIVSKVSCYLCFSFLGLSCLSISSKNTMQEKKAQAGLFEAKLQFTLKCPAISAYCDPTKAVMKNQDILLLSVLTMCLFC